MQGGGGRDVAFVGRVAELAAVVAAIDARSVALTGPAGVGKSRLASEVATASAARGVTTARISGAHGGRNVPLFALRPLIGGSDPSAALGALHETLGLGRHRPGPGDPVLLVDDAHLLDDTSLAVLGQVLDADRIRLLLTVRDDASGPALSALLRRPEGARHRVAPLDAADASRLLESLLGGPVEGRSLQVVIGAARGNALVVRELAIGAVDVGALVCRNGVWMLVGEMRPTAVLSELVAERLSSVSPEAGVVMELLAVGGPLPIDLVLAGASATGIEELERRGIVRLDATLEVTHPLYREVVASSLGTIGRLRRLRDLVALVDETRPADLDSLVVQTWRLSAELPLDPAAALEAAQQATVRKDPALGAEFALASYRARPSTEAAILAGWCLGTTGRQAEAEAIAVDAQTRLPDPMAQAALALRRAEERWWWAHDVGAARRILDDGVARIAPSPWADLLRAQHGVFAALDGDGNAAANAAPLLTHELVWVRRTASIAAAFGHALAGRADAADAISDAAITDAFADPDQILSGDPAVHVMSRLFSGLHGSDAAATLELAETVYGFASAQPSVQGRGWAALMRSLALMGVGRPLGAARFAREAEILWVDAAVSGLARWCVTSLGLAQLTLGDATAATEALHRLRAYEIAGFSLNAPFEARLDAGLQAAAGRRDDAVRLLLDAATAAGRVGALVHAADCLHDLVRMAGPDGTEAAADHLELIADAEGPTVHAQRSMIVAAAADDPTGLESVAVQFAAMGRELFAAEAWAATAAAHRRVGRRNDAGRCAAASGELANRCEGAASPLVAEPPLRDRLSGREREIAELAARGMTNRDIAEELVVSERTVESHLYRVFAKLGVSARGELSVRLGPTGPGRPA